MSTFNARLHLPGRAKLPLGVEIDIDNEKMALISGKRTVAVLPLDDLEIVSKSDGFHLRFDGEDVVLIVQDSARFAAALGIEEHRRPSAVGASRSQPASGDAETAGLERRVSEVRETLRSEATTPSQACAEWIGLLKEINRRHGQGSIAAGMFYRLNSELLDLIPDPALVAESA